MKEVAPDAPPGRRGVAAAPKTDDYERAMARAGRLLAARPRATNELRGRLLGAGFAPGPVERALARLTELGLLDDDSFARQWVAERSRSRSSRALLHELGAKGIDRAVAERAVAEAEPNEESAAAALAARYVGRVSALPLPKQALRIAGMLARRGYPSDIVEKAVKAVLPPEGWD